MIRAIQNRYYIYKVSFAFLTYIALVIPLYSQDKPNIIVIYTDDQGYADLGVQGLVDDIKTPHIDQLAGRGVRMTSGYVTAPQCIPSRSGLLSGVYQQRYGLDHNGTIPMPLDQELLPQMMQKAGYITGMTGKWHLEPNHQQITWIEENLPQLKDKEVQPSDISLEEKMPYYPSSRGFDEYFYGPMNRYWINYDLQGNKVEPQWKEEEGYRLDLQTEATTAFIKRNKDQAFFYYLSYFAPHVPLEATEKYLKRFPGDMPERRRYCLAMMSAIDDGVGQIKETLEELGLLENTLIFFISDNGAPLKIDKKDIPISFKGGAWDGSLNGPLVGEKGMITEGGIRVPYIISWPKVLPKGKVYHRPVISLDVAATALAVAGLDPNPNLDGVNLIPFLKESLRTDPHENLYWRFWNQTAIRSGDFKYLVAGNKEYLFDLSESPVEDENIISQYPQLAAVMRKKLERWTDELKNPGISQLSLTSAEEAWYEFYLPKTIK
ncbi:hypothetical protein GCM10007049_06320 [Echinicola pacifica]|uniref:Sulfatase N-terminal domain-containing protein n=1 Tax=Echinicola pacifica TaxID=346377 RepID=A0A918UKM1_9BACT|nr:sulfatase-like hydrolase/transferase [Echinicola pacifica]GGZ16682.1 hypothetical protein GCM10007049_06320 [Echinicola pacifica]